MTKELFQDIKRSLRVFCYNLDTTMTWHLDEIDETITADTFGIVKTSTESFLESSFRGDMINLNVFAKTLATIELKVGMIYSAINNNYINIKNYVEAAASESVDLATIGYIRIKRIDIRNIGNTEGNYQTNLGIFYEIGE